MDLSRRRPPKSAKALCYVSNRRAAASGGEADSVADVRPAEVKLLSAFKRLLEGLEACGLLARARVRRRHASRGDIAAMIALACVVEDDSRSRGPIRSLTGKTASP